VAMRVHTVKIMRSIIAATDNWLDEAAVVPLSRVADIDIAFVLYVVAVQSPRSVSVSLSSSTAK
jgi:hypothetical protein